uniref:Uncharacterized protein LOC100367616 n=1 Tax=Saccoglossus kowalevskii TaxID=10224 RepID=A0ABM0GPH7_SACKO|nr:PREDICTED: uncharacterized protein LOC100367616 [Saccoglossus kowalevskii]
MKLQVVFLKLLALFATISSVCGDTGGLTQEDYDFILQYVTHSGGFWGNLADYINVVRNIVSDFDTYPVTVKASLVGAAVIESLTTDVTDLINDANSTWAEACYLYMNSELNANVSYGYKSRHCEVLFAYGGTVDEIQPRDYFYPPYDAYNSYGYDPRTDYHGHYEWESHSKYNPCSYDYRLFYPYGLKFGDNKNFINDEQSTGQIQISQPFPLFGTKYNLLRVNTNGVISVKKHKYTYRDFPAEFPFTDQTPMIAPFWGDVSTIFGGNVYWRESTDPIIIARALRDLKSYSCNSVDINVNWVFIATWDNTARSKEYWYDDENERNTFQAVLITDGEQSFTIFNYGDINWTTGTMRRKGGIPAEVGFNAGDGVSFYKLAASMKPEIVNIRETSNVGILGRYAFKTDRENIEEMCCAHGGSESCFAVRLQYYCYEIHTEEVTWATAANHCNSIDSDSYLARLDTQEKFHKVRKFIYDNGLDDRVRKGFWIGLSDRVSEGTFKWEKGPHLGPNSFTRWAPGQPNNNYQGDHVNGQDCVQLWKKSYLQWDDDYCGDNPDGKIRKKGYVCQYDCEGA